MNPHKTAFLNALIPVVLGIGGLVKLGRFDWGIAALVSTGAAFLYYTGYQRAKYGSPPVNSLILGKLPGRPPRL
jgi:hypothetical protein